MQALRATASLTRWVLAWFALTVAAAIASPLVRADGLQAICGAGAVRFVAQPGDDHAPAPRLTLDCALCTPAVVPPPTAVVAPVAVPLPNLEPVFVEQESWSPGPHGRPSARGPPQA